MTENTLRTLRDLAEKLEKLQINFRKDGSSRKTKEYLISKKNQTEEVWKQFYELHAVYIQTIDEEHSYIKENIFQKTKAIYTNLLDLITASSSYSEKENVLQANPDSKGTSSQFSQWGVIPPQYLDANRLNNLPKLPPVKIPKFTGDYREWQPFIEIFSTVIDANPYLSSVEKMQYLLYHLEGDARKIISHLQLTGTNYSTALELVKCRYNNNRKIITTYINSIMDAKKVEYRSQEDVIALYDTIRECLGALDNFNCHTEKWGPMIVSIAMRKLDVESVRLFEESLQNPREMPSTDELLRFLEKRHQVLDCVKASKQTKSEVHTNNKKRAFLATSKRSCMYCAKEHSIYSCADFKNLSVNQRTSFILGRNLCTNCMNHKKTEKCKTNKTCLYCKKRHHTLLHKNKDTNESFSPKLNKRIHENEEKKTQPKMEDAVSLHNKSTILNVLLPTAMVRIRNLYGQTEQYRALVDPGSQVSIVTEQAVQTLRLQKQRVSTTIFGVGEAQSAKSQSKVNLKLQLRHQPNTYLHVDALVLPKLNSMLPETPTAEIDISKYGNILLADPTFNVPGPIDLLLGADVYANIVLDGIKTGFPTAQNTKLGWIMFGNVPSSGRSCTKASSFISTAELDKKLEEFWEIPNNLNQDSEEDDIDIQFRLTHTRDQDGRYVVRLPYRENIGELGYSRERALARYLQIERKLQKSPLNKEQYNNFLKEYLTLGHMSPAKTCPKNITKCYYLPHHAVFKKESTTTKLRVVFDASCKTTSGLSLNDVLYTGKNLQEDLSQILLRWRKHRYVFTADIEKMFRQIKVSGEDKNYQRILWRQQPSDPIQEYVLNTVTYGTAPATYLAIRALKQLAEDEGHKFPIAKKVLRDDFYVDDMLSGADSRKEALCLQEEIINLLRLGGFNLRKWTSNTSELLIHIPEDLLETNILEIGDNESVKTLGIRWNPKRDEFQFTINFQVENEKYTKRTLLSQVASIFDPLGWLAPVTVTAKLLMQSLWKAGTNWDDIPPADILKAWKKLENELKELQSIKIPRWITYRAKQEFQLHGFCDASEKAYAAVVYARTRDSFGKTHVTLLTAKTRVAPLKQKLTIPRLELCGALLLAELLNNTVSALQIDEPTIFAWCDSEIALAWITNTKHSWGAYVSNKINRINRLVDRTLWRYVSSSENSADVASRGISPCKLSEHHLWWRGPLWLAKSPEAWPLSNRRFATNQEERKNVTSLTITVSTKDVFKCSKYTTQRRVIAYCLRFIRNCRLPKATRLRGYLSTRELQEATDCIIKAAQAEEFQGEISDLKKDGLKRNSKLLSLNPFIDAAGLLRVGGRLQKSNLPFDSKHQLLIPKNHHITHLLIDYAHRQSMHGGTQLTLSYIRNRFWIIDGKRVVQGAIHKCITCTRQRQKTNQPLMGELPAVRITPSPPFSSCGVDYAGPFITKASKGRGIKTTKGYISLFVCMVTKAIHLELVTDLTTDAFLAAYRRFVARRGNCKEIYSDNGTNFIGAKNQMDKDLKTAILNSTKVAAEALVNDGTEWKFIPVASPHFGGLWEAGVKSVKGHLRRVLGETLLTYEEFSTVLCQVEACLNSRPLGQQSNDPTDLEPLTPGHFLIGRPLIAPPVPHVDDREIHQRWKFLTKLQQDIWRRWSQEYLSLLQQRSKWRKNDKNPEISELVLIKEENLPPQKWSMGRIVELHPGEDGIVRVVSVRNRGGIKKRPLNKLCQLPINTYNDSKENENDSCNNVTVTMTTKVKIHKGFKKERTANQEPELWSKREHFDRITTKRTNTTPLSTIRSKRLKVAREPCSLSDQTETKKEETLTGNTTFKRKKSKIFPCTWATKLLHTTLLILYWLTIALADDFEIVQPKLGFYLEELGNTRIKRGNLRLEVTLAKEEILADRIHIDKTWSEIKTMCEKTQNLIKNTHCPTLFQHLSTRRQHLLKATEEILQLTEQKNRNKRGLLGKFLTSVFGVNDEVYHDIESLQYNQQDLLQLTNHQVLLLNTKINQSNFNVMEKLRQFDTRLSQVITSINEMATWYTSADHNRIGIEVISTYLGAEDYFDELQEKINSWLLAIHGQAHILNFITTQDINAVTQNISQKVGSNFLIIKTPQNRVDVKVEGTIIKLYGYLNIVEETLFNLIHVTPTPHLIKDDKYAIADIRFSTLAISFNQQLYFSLTKEELTACSVIDDLVYLCAPKIVYNIEESPSCVIDEIYQRHPKKACKFRQLELTGIIWKTLVMKNTWMFVTKESRVIAITCRGSRTEALLNGTGIIHLSDSCFIKTKELILKTTIDETATVIRSHMMEVPLINFNIDFKTPPKILKSGTLFRPNEQILDYNAEPEPHTTVLRKTLIYHSVTTSVGVAIFIIALITFKYWNNVKVLAKCCRPENRVQPPQPDSIHHNFNRVMACSTGGPQHVHT